MEWIRAANTTKGGGNMPPLPPASSSERVDSPSSLLDTNGKLEISQFIPFQTIAIRAKALKIRFRMISSF
jgi:hypothetical protein